MLAVQQSAPGWALLAHVVIHGCTLPWVVTNPLVLSLLLVLPHPLPLLLPLLLLAWLLSICSISSNTGGITAMSRT
jgi:hypothetical protein